MPSPEFEYVLRQVQRCAIRNLPEQTRVKDATTIDLCPLCSARASRLLLEVKPLQQLRLVNDTLAWIRRRRSAADELGNAHLGDDVVREVKPKLLDAVHLGIPAGRLDANLVNIVVPGALDGGMVVVATAVADVLVGFGTNNHTFLPTKLANLHDSQIHLSLQCQLFVGMRQQKRKS